MQQFKNSMHIFHMLLLITWIYQYVIQIHQDTLVKQLE